MGWTGLSANVQNEILFEIKIKMKFLSFKMEKNFKRNLRKPLPQSIRDQDVQNAGEIPLMSQLASKQKPALKY